MQNSQST